MDKIRVLLVEDDYEWLHGLTAYLRQHEDIILIATASTGEEALQIINNIHIDVVLMDIFLSGKYDGITATLEILQSKQLKIIMLTSSDHDSIIFNAYAAGAVDYIVKSNFLEIPDAIRAAYQNRSPIRPSIAHKIRKEFSKLKKWENQYKIEQVKSLLTPTEISILKLIYQGYTQREIADKMFISIRTVKNHVNSILKKMNEKNSKHAAKRAKDIGVI
jgi:DNA-binding NarL/FixJ family response regulator